MATTKGKRVPKTLGRGHTRTKPTAFDLCMLLD